MAENEALRCLAWSRGGELSGEGLTFSCKLITTYSGVGMYAPLAGSALLSPSDSYRSELVHLVLLLGYCGFCGVLSVVSASRPVGRQTDRQARGRERANSAVSGLQTMCNV